MQDTWIQNVCYIVLIMNFVNAFQIAKLLPAKNSGYAVHIQTNVRRFKAIFQSFNKCFLQHTFVR